MLNARFKPTLIAAAVAIAGSAYVAQASAQEQTLYTLDLPAGTLTQSLNALARQTKLNLSADPALLNGHSAPAISGRYSIEKALERILSGTQLQATKTPKGGYSITRASQNETAALETLIVKGRQERFGDSPIEPGGFKAEYQTTATKMAIPLKETPQAISVVTHDFLDARMARDLSSAVEITPSISNSANGEGTQSGPGMFGGKGKYDQKFVLRGQPMSARSDGFLIGNNDIDLAAYERVEVIKGPSGFYGQGSLGGFINMVRKKPQEEFAASISGEAGSFDTYRNEGDITGALNEQQNLLGRLNFVYDDSGSFVEGLDSQRVMIAPGLEAVIHDKTRILAQFLYQKDRFNANPGMPLNLVGDKLQPFVDLSSPTTLYGTLGDKSETEIKELKLQLDHQISDRWLASVLFQKNNSTRDIVNPNYVSTYYGNFYIGRTKDIREDDFWAGELRLRGEYDAFGQSHQLLVGLEHNEQLKSRDWGSGYAYLGAVGSYSFMNPTSAHKAYSLDEIPTTIDRDIHDDNSAIYAQTVISLQNRTKLLLGGRYDKIHQTTIRRDGRTPGTPLDDSAFTGKVGLTHTINNNITTYGIYAESFEPNWGVDENGALDPITGTGYELGLKTEWFDQKLGANLSVYRHELTNSPLSDPNNDLYNIAAGKHRTDGIELEISGSPTPGLNLVAAYTWMDNEFIEKDDNYYKLSIDGSVDQQFGLFAQYEFQQGLFKGLGLGVTYVHIGQRNFVNTQTGPYSQMYLDGYDRLDLNISYNGIPNWDMNLLVRNVTDETYIESATSRHAGNYFGSPVAALFKATYNF